VCVCVCVCVKQFKSGGGDGVGGGIGVLEVVGAIASPPDAETNPQVVVRHFLGLKRLEPD
jgi:hypothetical protein